MSKVLKKAAVVVGVAALILTGVGAVVGATAMAGVTAALGGVTAGILTTVAAGLSIAAQLLAKKPSGMPGDQTNRLFANLDPNAPRKIAFGRTAFATDIRYQGYTGANQNYLNWIIAAASHKVAAIEEVWFDNRLAWTSAGGVNSAAFDPWFLQIYAKTEGTTGNGFAVDSAWTAASSLTGCAHLWFRFLLTEKSKSTPSPFAQSVPTRITIVGQGMPLPDIRVPGVDPDDQSTWVFGTGGRNPALQMLAYLLGWRIEGKLAVGKGVPASRLDLDSFVTAANLCDEPVALAAGGTEPRYRSDGVFSEADSPSTVLGNLNAAMNSVLRDAGGKLSLTVLHNDLAVPVAAFDQNDILGDEVWKQTGALHDGFNLVRGRYVDPSNYSLYQLADYPEVALPSLDGIDRIDTFELPLVQSASQAQRLAKQRLQRVQYQGTYSATLNARAWQVSLGDVVTLSHGTMGWADKLFRVAAHGVQLNGQVPVVLVEENAQIYAWDADESPAVVPAVPTVYDPTLHPWYKQFRPAPNGQLLLDDTFDPRFWIWLAWGERIELDRSRAIYALTIGFEPGEETRFYYTTDLDRMPRVYPGKPLFGRVRAIPSAVVPVDMSYEGVDLFTDETYGEPVLIRIGAEANWPLELVMLEFRLNGDLHKITPLAVLDAADADAGQEVWQGSAVAEHYGYATLGFRRLVGSEGEVEAEGGWTVMEPWLAEYEPTADVTTNIPTVPDTVIQLDSAGIPKAGQVNPRYVQFQLLKAGEDITAQAQWSWELKTGAFSAAFTETPGRLNVTLFEAAGTGVVTATYMGRPYSVEHRLKQERDGAVNTGGGGGGGGTGTEASSGGAINGSALSTTPEPIGDEITIEVGGSGTVNLYADYDFSTVGPIAGGQKAYVAWYRWNGAAYVSVAGEQVSVGTYFPQRPEPAHGGCNVTDSGLTPATVEKYRLYGRSQGAWATSFAGTCTASTS